MSGQTPFSNGPATWCLSHFPWGQHTAALVLAALIPAIGFFAGWVLRPIVSEYVKAWHFFGVPPWRYRPATLKQIERREQAVAVREQELTAHMAAFEALMERAERIEGTNIALRIENAGLRVEVERLQRPRQPMFSRGRGMWLRR